MNAATPAPTREESAQDRWDRIPVIKTGDTIWPACVTVAPACSFLAN